jgi:uncharacterized coiled-coil DUF342 family protein
MSLRDAYVKKLKARMNELNAEIERLASKADAAHAETKIMYYKQLENLRERRKGMEDSIEELQNAGESAWEDLKQGLENSWEILKVSLTKAKSEFERGYKEGTKED